MIRRLLLLLPFLLFLAPAAHATNEAAHGWCELGGQPVVFAGFNSTTTVQASYPSCTVTVSVHGGGLATIYSDASNTPLANPFTAQTNGQWTFYAADGRYDVTMTGGGLPSTVTYSDILLNSSGGGGGGGTPCTTIALALQYNNGGSFGCVPMTYTSGTTLLAAASGLNIDLGAATKVLLPSLANTQIPYYTANGLAGATRLTWTAASNTLYVGTLSANMGAFNMHAIDLALASGGFSILAMKSDTETVDFPNYGAYPIYAQAYSHLSGAEFPAEAIIAEADTDVAQAAGSHLVGIDASAEAAHTTGNVPFLIGIKCSSANSATTPATVGQLVGCEGGYGFDGTAVQGDAYAFHANAPGLEAGGHPASMGNSIGFKIENMDPSGLGVAATGVYGIYIADQGSDHYSIYSVAQAIHLGSIAGNKPTPANGDIWYNSSSNIFVGRQNGATDTFAMIQVAQSWSAAQTCAAGCSWVRSGGGTLDASTLLGNSWAAPGNIGLTTPGQVNSTSFTVDGVAQIFNVATDFTTANNTSLQAITGLSWTVPASTVMNIPFSCHLSYSQATAAVAVSFGIQDVSVAPTNLLATGHQQTDTTVFTGGTLAALASTTATAIVSATPAATTTKYTIDLNGFIEQPSNAMTSAINIMVKTATGGDAVTIYRGSFCRIN